MRFLDTNVILRYLTNDDEAKARDCYELLQRAQRGEEELLASESVVAECAYVLSSPRLPYRLTHEEIRVRLLPVLELRSIRIRGKRVVLRALDLYAAYEFLDFEDALAVAHMEREGCEEIVSYDRDFDRVPSVRRAEP